MGKIDDFLLKKLEETYPNLLKAGDDYLLKKEYKEAIALYKKAEQTHATNPYLYYNRATCYFALGNFTEAIKDFKRTVRLKNDFTDAYCNWALSLMSLDRYRESVKIFKDGIKTNPEDPKINLHYALVQEKLDNYDEAKKYCNKVLELCPIKIDGFKQEANQFHIMALNQLALIEIKQNKHQEAINQYQKIVKLNPKFAPAFYNMAICYTNLKKADMAIKCLAKAKEIDYKVSKRAKEDPNFKPLENLQSFKDLFFK